MTLVVILEHRFAMTPDGRVWTRTAYGTTFWDRHLTTFERVKVVARASRVPAVDSSHRLVTGRLIEFVAIPDYLGPFEYLKVRRRVRQRLFALLDDPDAILCRVSSQLATELLPALWRAGRPYGLEVVGDPYDAFRPGAIRHPLRPFFRHRSTYVLKAQCARAAAVSYVTSNALQRRYPAPITDVMYAASDAELDDSYFVDQPRVYAACSSGEPHRLLFIGSLAQMYKAPDILIRAVQLILKTGGRVHLTLIGDGKHRPELERLARTLDVEAYVTFVGELASGRPVRDRIDAASLVVLPSRTEGLPRVLLEAMARGIPAIGTTVGGIPELLEAEDMVPPDDAEALAARMKEVLDDPGRLTRMSARNLERVQGFRHATLRNIHAKFYATLRSATERWLASPALTSARGRSRVASPVDTSSPAQRGA